MFSTAHNVCAWLSVLLLGRTSARLPIWLAVEQSENLQVVGIGSMFYSSLEYLRDS